MLVKNFSRHELNEDQIKALVEIFGKVEVSKPLAPFFAGAEDVAEKVNGSVSALVVPWNMILKADALNMIERGTILIAWSADENARKRGRFALRGVETFEFVNDGSGNDISFDEYKFVPTVETDFKTGEVFPYQD